MDLSNYLNKRVQIILLNKFTYIGLVVFCDSNSITILDKTHSEVQIKESSIELIKVLDNAN